jgi:hypothetical protein
MNAVRHCCIKAFTHQIGAAPAKFSALKMRKTIITMQKPRGSKLVILFEDMTLYKLSPCIEPNEMKYSIV